MLKVNKVSAIGFKNHVELVKFEFSDLTRVAGDNAKGKTAIGELISWAFLGTNLFGNERADSDLVNKDTNMTEVEVGFTTEDGDHELIRRRRGNKTDIYLNGNKLTNLEAKQEFGDKDIFLTIFNPAYFPSKAPKDAKEILNHILGKIEDEEVFEKIGEYQRDLLVKNNFKNSNLFLEGKRAELKEIDEDLIYIDGLIDGKKLDKKVPEEKQFNDSELNDHRLELKKLEDIKSLHDIGDLKNRKNELEKEIFKLENTMQETNVVKIENKILELEMAKKYPEIGKPELIDIQALEGKRELLLSEYNHVREQFFSLDNAIKCNKCGNEMDLDIDRKKELKIELEEIKASGLAMKEKIEQSIMLNEKAEEKYKNDVNKHVSKVEKDIAALSKERQEKLDQDSESKKESVNKVLKLKKEINNLRIEELEKENEISEKEYRTKKEEAKEKIRLLEQVEHEVRSSNAARLKTIEDIEESKKEIEKLLEKIESQKKRKDEIKQQVDAAKLFNSTKLDIQTENIDKHLDKVSIKLQDIVKSTGELKDTFKIMYEDTEFNLLSASEKIKAGLEIANLTMSVLDIKIPIFIDNAESITRYKVPDTQIIEARVVEDKELTVEVG